jgi:hypothetical protein
VADAVERYSDTIAGRAGALGGTAEGTIQIAVEHSFLERYRLGIADAESHIAAVTAALAAVAAAQRGGYRPPGRSLGDDLVGDPPPTGSMNAHLFSEALAWPAAKLQRAARAILD